MTAILEASKYNRSALGARMRDRGGRCPEKRERPERAVSRRLAPSTSSTLEWFQDKPNRGDVK